MSKLSAHQSPGDSVLIVNPKAGSAENAGELLAMVDRLGVGMFHQTQTAGEAGELAWRSVREGYRRIIVAGGDGTINEVINGVAPDFNDIELGIVPMGTGNDASRSLGIPTNLAGAFDVLRQGHVRAIDLLKYTGPSTRYFLNASAAGFSGAVNEKIDRKLKSKWGPFAYMLSAAAALPDLVEYHLSLTIDRHRFSVSAYNIVVANGRYVAGGVPIAPQARLDDGKLDLIIVPSESLADAALAVPEIIFGRHVESDRVITVQARTLIVRSEPPMPFNVDGELMGEGEARFEVLPRALKVIVGADAEGLAGQDTE